MKETALMGLLYLKGSAFIAFGVLHFFWRRHALRSWPKADGTVDGSRFDRDGNLIVTIVYSSASGESHRAIVGGSSGLGLGSVVTVAYDPRDPNRALILGRGGVGAWTYLLIIVGCILVAVGYQLS